jgi:DNA-directed RNA polymerase specialized sigma24 family protein
MSRIATTPVASSRRPFAALDREWALLCRRQRHSAPVRRWAAAEPALAGLSGLGDLVPPPGTDRGPVCAAVARLAAGGDPLARRALLQLLVPGLVRLAGRWRRQLGGMDDAGWEVLARASEYVARLGAGTVACSPAGYVLRSVERDLASEVVQARARARAALAQSSGARHAAPSAEAAAFAHPLQRHLLDRAAALGAVSPATAELLWQHAAHDRSVPDAAHRAGVPVATAYRLRDRARDRLQPLVA